jgi:hypothetical protein
LNKGAAGAPERTFGVLVLKQKATNLVHLWCATVDRMNPIGGHSLVQKRQNFETTAKDYLNFG